MGAGGLMKALYTFAAAICVALVMASVALAMAPQLTSVSSQQRQPTVTFSAPRAGAVTVYLATKPDRGADGLFLQKNLRDAEILTPADIQGAKWTDPNRVDPGTYYVMLRAQANFDACYVGPGLDPACADGFSDVRTLVVPKPTTQYSVRVKVDRKNAFATLLLTATPMGEQTPYRVCYRTAAGAKRCTAGLLQGWDWDRSVQNAVYVHTNNLPPVATFTWLVRGQQVAVKRVRVR